MSLIPGTGAPRDHGGIAEAPDPGTRPLERAAARPRHGPARPWRTAGGATAGATGPTTTRGSGAGTAITTRAAIISPAGCKHLRRNPDNRVLGGVCGALSESFGVDVTLVRIGVVVLSPLHRSGASFLTPWPGSSSP